MKKLIIILFIPFYLYSVSLIEYSENPLISKKQEYQNYLNVYEWEEMYFFMFNKLYAQTYKDYRMQSLLNELNNNKIASILSFKRYFNKNHILFSSPEITSNGDFVFPNEKINKVYTILSNSKGVKDVFSAMCIAQNSLIYKYSILDPEETFLDISLFYREKEKQNIDLLYMIDKMSYSFGYKGCCELTNILCK